MIDLRGITFGAEYEYGDVDRNAKLPPGLSWNTKDYSIVSSTGIANDPKGLLYGKGGEINSAPTTTIAQQLEFFSAFVEADLGPQLNHRTNLHLHVCVPGLAEDLGMLKRLLAFIDRHQRAIYRRIEPVPRPMARDFRTVDEFTGAEKRYKRRLVSHQYAVPKARVDEAMQAATPRQFFDAHSRLQSDGKRAYGLTTRAGINLLQLQETNTIEFRHFTNTLRVRELATSFAWVLRFVECALEGTTLDELLAGGNHEFPPFRPYNHDMETGYQYTNFDKHPRKVVAARLEAMRKDLDLERCSATDVARWVREVG